MSYLSQVKEGKIVEPVFALVYGVPGIGKSTLASEGPSPLFFGDEKESSHLNVARLPEPKTFKDCKDQILELINTKSKFKTLAVDNLGWIENLIWKSVCEDWKKPTIEGIGYGKGYVDAVVKHTELINLLSDLREKQGTNIVVIGHSKVKTFQDPTLTSGYDRYQLSIHEAAANVWYRSVDAVLFMNYETLKTSDEDRRAVGVGVRVMYTDERPSFIAKNRYGLPFRIPMRIGESWKTLFEAIVKGEPNSPEVLLAQIEGYKANIKDQAVLDKITVKLKEVGRDTAKLTAIKDQLISLVGGLG
jgi:hypothetical protein